MIADFYWPYLGGVEQHVRSLAHALVERGHTVTVATLGRSDLADEVDDQGVLVCRLRSTTQRMPWLFSSAERPWAPPFPDPSISRQLRRLIERHRPHIVHGHDWLARSFLPLSRWSERRFGTRLVSSLHYYTLSCAKKNLMRTVPAAGATNEEPCSGPAPLKCLDCARRHYGPITGTITTITNQLGAAGERRASSAIVAVSTATARGNGLDPRATNVVVVPNFLTDGPRAARAGEHGSAARLGALPHGEFVMFVGDLRPMKGLDVLLDAYAGSSRSMPLVLIGKSWPDTPTSFPDGVTVHDRWPNSVVLQAWRRSAIAVVPSVWAEPFGIVVIEAMAAGSPVIGSNVGGVPEIVDDGVSGLLVPPGDVAALRAALEDLMGDPDRRAAMGAAARARALHFTASAVMPRLEALYSDVLTTLR